MIFWDVVKVFLVLGLVLMGVVYVIKYGLVWLQPGHFKGGTLAIMERLPLSPKSGLYLVRAGERRFLLGVTQDRIHMLAELDPQEASPSRDEDAFRECLNNSLSGGEEGESLAAKARQFVRGKLQRRRSHEE